MVDTFQYAQTGWKDQLISYNGKACTYDALGNLTQYGDKTLTWTKVRKLASFGNITFTYDARGMRTEKSANGVTHSYIYEGDLLLKETIGNNTITYYHGNDGINGFNYLDTDFFYRKNLQGDVIAICTADGTVLAKYVYDAWGNHKVYDGNNIPVTIHSHIGYINPIRYRGYYYDVETKLYYCQARYYSPELCRFIQPADVSSLNPSGINGLNLYSYAISNPIGIAYSGSSGGGSTSSGMVLSTSTNGSYLSGLNGTSGNNFLGNLISGASSLHGGIDKISSYLAGSVDGLLTYMNNPKYKGFHNKLNSYSNWLMGIGIGLDIASSAYNNYMNPNLTAGQKWASFGADVGYIAATSGLSYIAGDLLTKGAVALGALVGGIPGGIIVVVGIVAGTVLIAVISDALDNWWEKKKEEWFN